jgi:hypothetical protein
MDVREWAGTTATRYDLHRFTSPVEQALALAAEWKRNGS